MLIMYLFGGVDTLHSKHQCGIGSQVKTEGVYKESGSGEERMLATDYFSALHGIFYTNFAAGSFRFSLTIEPSPLATYR